MIEKGFSFDDMLLVPQYSDIASRSNIDTNINITKNHNLKYPVISANMDSITGVEMANTMSSIGAIGILNRHEFKSVLEHYKAIHSLYVPSFCIGVKKRDREVLAKLIENHETHDLIITIDVAHGHSKNVSDTIKWLRNKLKDVTIIAGNVATPKAALDLIDWGADGIKIGIGPGSLCSTRIMTGCGYPQLSAIMRIHSAIEKANKRDKIFLIADGGIRYAGDIVKSLAAGADLIMIGNLLAGTIETPGKVYYNSSGGAYKIYRGQASHEAQAEQNKKESEIYAEGVYKEVPYTHTSAKDVVEKLMKGVRSGMSYCGASNISELRDKAQFVEITPATLIENKPYGLS